MCSFSVSLLHFVNKVVLEKRLQEDGSVFISVKNTGHPKIPQGALRSLILLPAKITSYAVGDFTTYQIEEIYDSVSIETNFGRSKGRNETTYFLSLILTLTGPNGGTKKQRIDCASIMD